MMTFLNFFSHTIRLGPPSFTCYQKFTSLTTLEGQKSLDVTPHFILKYNFFKFDNQFYLQIHGTAMGTTFAPNYSGVFLGNFVNTALCNAPNNLQPIIWKCFIDDIFMVWTHGEAALQNFHTYLNNLHPTIKPDITYSTKEINFLDTTIYFNSHHKLESTLYVKPTDICALLHSDSFHPSNCKGQSFTAKHYAIGE